jgi:protein-tyrosine-phosphatase
VRKDFVITMTTNERKKLETKCSETKALLVEIAEKIEDSKERQDFWAKIRNFNEVTAVFSE